MNIASKLLVGFAGTHPNCYKQRCAPGLLGEYPNCYAQPITYLPPFTTTTQRTIYCPSGKCFNDSICLTSKFDSFILFNQTKYTRIFIRKWDY